MSDVEKSNPEENESEIIYVKEKPLLKLFVGTLVAIVSIAALLFFLGLILSFTGFRAPTFDKQIIQDQYDKTIRGAATSFGDCVAKEGSLQEVFPPTCTFKGDTFTQTTMEACGDLTIEARANEALCGESNSSEVQPEALEIS